MPSPEPSRRGTARRTGAETTALVLEAALHTVAEDGVDQAALTRVAKRAGMSIGPLYSRFDDTDDLVAALWTAELREHLHRVFADAAAWLTGDGTTAGSLLHHELAKPSARTQALLEVLATVRRYPYSGDLITTDAREAYAGYLAAVRPIPPVVAGYALGTLLGRVFLHPMLSPRCRSTPDDFLRIVHVLAHSWEGPAATTEFATTVPMPVIESGNAVPDTFLNAALQVIARGGFEHASANRIARAAGMSASRVYSHFDSKHDLAAQALATIIDQIVGASALAFVGVDPTTYQQMVLAAGRALCDPASGPARRLRMECALAARHHDDVNVTARRAFDRAERAVADAFRAVAPDRPESALQSALTMWHMVRNFGFGVVPLHEAAGALDPDLDIAPLANALPQIYRQYVLDPFGR